MAFAFGIAWRIMPEPTRRRNHLCQQIVSSALHWMVVHILTAMFPDELDAERAKSFSTTSKCWVNGQNVQPHLRVRIPSSRRRLPDSSLVLSHDAFGHWHP